jgi:hypothetical protein
MLKKMMGLVVGLGLVAAVGTQAKAETYPPRGAYGWHGGWHGPVYRGPVYRGGWGYGYYAPGPVVHVWVPGYWAVRPWGRVWIGGYYR